MNDTYTAGECFGLSWIGKQQAIADAASPPCGSLREEPNKGLHPDTTENLYLEGDCLDVMKLLRHDYRSRIKMIYMDPPYNTGSELVYRDHFRQQGETDSAGRLHSAWCSMMYSRLIPARELLSEDGVLFISIGEQELHTLTCLCDEVFRPENRLALFCRVTKRSSNSGEHFSPCVDYVLIYAKDAAKVPPYCIGLPEEIASRYKKRDAHYAERGPYQEVSLYMSALKHGGSRYPIRCPDGSHVIPPEGKPWRWNAQTLLRGLAEDRIIFKRSHRSPLLDADTGGRAGWNIYTKMYLRERTGAGLHPKNFSDAFQNTQASHELRRLGIPFDFAKPVSLLAYFVQLQTAGEDIILDCFSGSATTAHAVMQSNAQDGGRRRFFMIQIPEKTRPGSRACREGFSDICEIGRERIRRAGDALRRSHPDAVLDTGFRVLRHAVEKA